MKKLNFPQILNTHMATIEWLCNSDEDEQKYKLIAYCLLKKACDNPNEYIDLWDHKKDWNLDEIKHVVTFLADEVEVKIEFIPGYKFRIRKANYIQKKERHKEQSDRYCTMNDTVKYSEHYERYWVNND